MYLRIRRIHPGSCLDVDVVQRGERSAVPEVVPEVFDRALYLPLRLSAVWKAQTHYDPIVLCKTEEPGVEP